MRLVLLDESNAVDSIAMTISHRNAAVHAIKALCWSEFKRRGYSMA
jgi:hypothetical protein